MGFYIIFAAVGILMLAILITSFTASICPKCKHVSLKHMGSKEVERTPVILSRDRNGAATLSAVRVVTEHNLKCKGCGYSYQEKSERII